jgi:uncharacterized membrane protein
MAQRLFFLGFLVFLAGFALLLAGILGQGGASVGGVVFVGPFPIAFGSGPGGWVLALGSVLIGAVMVVLLLVWGLLSREVKQG